MKTTQPNDFGKTPDEYLIESRMSVSEQRMYLRNTAAKGVLFVFAVWIGVWCINELHEAYVKAEAGQEAMK